MTKYQITMDERQVGVLLDALDLYSRCGMGQLEIVEEFLRMNFFEKYHDQPVRQDIDLTRGPVVRAHLGDVKALVFGYAPNQSNSIRNESVPIRCREAYDIIQVLRKARAESRIKQGEEIPSWSTHLDKYWATNPEWPPVEVSVLEED